MLRALGDRYTRFLDPDQFRRMQEDNSGRYGGLGITLALNAKNQVAIAKMDAYGPSRKKGLRIGDVLLRIADHPIYPGRHAADHAQDLIHGNPGTSVTLVVQRKTQKKPLRFTLVRTLSYTPTVTYKMLARKVGYLKLDSFGERSDEEVGRALRKLNAQGMRSLVFDMRGNPGGYFNAAIDIASRFIGQKRIPVVYTRDRENNRVPVLNIPSKRMLPRVPVAVLVDHWSASASEIVAAAIQDTHSGILVGQRTYGKALVQTITPIPDGSALLITTHHYYTPLGTDINHKGVKPNILISPNAASRAGSDPSLQRAIAWLNDPSRFRLSTRR
jgi:carboxyl-terminal processing protease